MSYEELIEWCARQHLSPKIERAVFEGYRKARKQFVCESIITVTNRCICDEGPFTLDYVEFYLQVLVAEEYLHAA